ncbi:MAG: hypothetical protein Q8Q75_18330 [Rhodoferax sp.]|uniref:hypothetical protein n=1 Tax=Rhodoferax sp. TaxID=50421 RepID=UPI0027375D70|nr:hypothetical protein [Rhodoferax sp.]MDP3866657.1 hypothetical protein [Rhodoferax sp.]
MKIVSAIVIAVVLSLTRLSLAAVPAVGAAPKGDPVAVATKIIKYNFPDCKRVSGATRSSDGSIWAKCDGVSYLVFTLFNAKEGKVIEVAMNCSAAKRLLNVAC